jgi:hypothetical protein
MKGDCFLQREWRLFDRLADPDAGLPLFIGRFELGI